MSMFCIHKTYYIKGGVIMYDMLNLRFQKMLKLLKGFFNYTDNNKYNLLNNIYNKIQIGNHTQQI